MIVGVADAVDTAKVRRVARIRGSLPVPLRGAAAVVKFLDSAVVVRKNGVLSRITSAVFSRG